MTPPSPADAASSEDASDGGTSQREERILDSTERASLGPLTAINEALMDASLGAILEGLRAAVAGEQSHVWSALNDSARLRAVYDTGLLEPGPHPEIDQIVGLTIDAVGIPNAALNMITDVEQVTAGIASRSDDIGEQRTHPLPESLCVYTVVSGLSTHHRRHRRRSGTPGSFGRHKRHSGCLHRHTAHR